MWFPMAVMAGANAHADSRLVLAYTSSCLVVEAVALAVSLAFPLSSTESKTETFRWNLNHHAATVCSRTSNTQAEWTNG